MNIDLLRSILLFAVLLIVQALVLNHIHLFDCATPLLYVYLALLFRRNYPCVDVFSNTPGVGAASMTFLGLIQPYLLALFVPRDSPDDLAPSMRSLGVTKFIYYTIISVFIYCIVFFTLETFNFFNWMQWLLCIGGSTVITVVLILVIENLRKR